MPAPGGGEVIDNDIINVASVKMQTHCDDGATNFCVDGDLGDDQTIPHICHRHHRRCLCKKILSCVKNFQIYRKKMHILHLLGLFVVIFFL